tara:strand:+ start:3715 stop:4056 length:342 start_codon:yes stop_codon:yes gene_type:complete
VNWLRWQPGRQGGGYRKLLLAQLPWADLYLLHMPEGSEIEPHTDPVDGKEHHRINLIIKAPRIGGWFFARGPHQTWLKGRVIRFRPDLVRHEVIRVDQGSRWVLSLGWVKEDR